MKKSELIKLIKETIDEKNINSKYHTSKLIKENDPKSGRTKELLGNIRFVIDFLTKVQGLAIHGQLKDSEVYFTNQVLDTIIYNFHDFNFGDVNI